MLNSNTKCFSLNQNYPLFDLVHIQVTDQNPRVCQVINPHQQKH